MVERTVWDRVGVRSTRTISTMHLEPVHHKRFSKEARDIIVRLGNIVESLEDEYPLTGDLSVELSLLKDKMNRLVIPSYVFEESSL